MRAARGNHAGVTKILLDRGAKVNARSISGYTAVMSAARWGCADVVQVLIAAGAEVNLKGRDGRTALACGLMAQLDREFTERSKIETLLRELLDAWGNRKSEQLSADQLAVFATAWQARQAAEAPDDSDDEDDD